MIQMTRLLIALEGKYCSRLSTDKKKNNAAQVVIAAITGLSVKDDKNIPIAINTHPSRKKARMDE